ncbi:MAG TPA: DUF2520 domain-containing protein [Acidimicrobiia bacterium]|jgi:predicted short-subunit dehydrogenase-like oxidoreductase (DUF2520 family)
MTEARACTLVGAGRAGTAVAIALHAAGWSVPRVAGRDPSSPAVTSAAARFGAEPVDVAEAGRSAALVLVATPDAAIRDTARVVAGSLETGALVVHLSGALGLDALDAVSAARADVSVGALHPLQTLPSPEVGAARLAGAWAAIAGPPAVRALAEELRMTPFEVADRDRAAYHAAATVASNHLTALLGQVERIASSAAVPLAAFEPLVQATVDNCFALGPAQALTGPVSRGEIDTLRRHLDAVATDEQHAYRALAAAAARLAGRDDPELRELLDP